MIKTKLVNTILPFFGASVQENDPTLLHVRDSHLPNLPVYPHEHAQQGEEIVSPVSKKKLILLISSQSLLLSIRHQFPSNCC